MKKKRSASEKQTATAQTQISLRDEDIQKISKAVTAAILEAEQQKKIVPASNACPREQDKIAIKEVLKVMFTPVKKLKVENSALSLVKLITSMTCCILSRLGYLCSILLLVGAIIVAFQKNDCLMLLWSPVAIIVWMISKLIDAAGVEIENSDNLELVFGLSAFLFAIIAIIISLVGKGG